MDNRILAAVLMATAVAWSPADSCGALQQSTHPNFGVSTGADSAAAKRTHADGIELIVLGIAQDAGFPQAGCAKACCQGAWKNPTLRRNVASVGVIDHSTGQRWLFDCTPDFPNQLRMLDERTQLISPLRNLRQSPGLEGIFLTHAHIGHYAGLIHLGRDMALIPHPFVAESINRFSPLDETVRKKVRFIHFNHTNPVLQTGSAAARDIERAGMNLAAEGEVIDL